MDISRKDPGHHLNTSGVIDILPRDTHTQQYQLHPEGHLSQVGAHHPYKKGVWHMQEDFGCPVVPVATNLGQRWNMTDWIKHAGHAQIEFLEPIPPGLGKDEFMALLQDRIETRSIELLDLNDLGALDPADIGRVKLNKIAQAREDRKQKQDEGRSA